MATLKIEMLPNSFTANNTKNIPDKKKSFKFIKNYPFPQWTFNINLQYVLNHVGVSVQEKFSFLFAVSLIKITLSLRDSRGSVVNPDFSPLAYCFSGIQE